MKTAEVETARLRAESREGDKTRTAALEKAMADLQKEHATLQQVYKEEQVLRKKYWNQMEDMKGKIRVYVFSSYSFLLLSFLSLPLPLPSILLIYNSLLSLYRYCRTRPPLKGETQIVVQAPDPYSCVLRHPRSGEHSFLFDSVYGPEATQETMFDDVKVWREIL